MTPAHQRLASYDSVTLEAETGLVIDLKRLVGDRLAQVGFQCPAGPNLRVHGGVEEAPGAAPGRFGGIHRQIGVLENLVEVCAVQRGERDADAGVGRYLMAEAIEGSADRFLRRCDDVGN